MTPYDFDSITPRRGTCSYKWDTPAQDNVLPMWVADMDFPTAPEIRAALQRRLDHGIFGYTKVPEAYYEATINWFRRRHGWSIGAEQIIYTSGVVPALSAIIQALTEPGDRVLVQTPVYNCFFSSIRNSRCQVAENPLRYENGLYSIDFEDLELKAANPAVKLMLLCNPHNPSGRVWSRDELAEISRICEKHGVFVVSDEIHGEITAPGFRYTPYATLGESARLHSATCVSPSKAFNIAGLQVANIVCADDSIRRRIDKAINVNEVCDINAFAVPALIAAYNEGEPWLNALNAYLHANDVALREYCRERLPQYPMPPLEATYLEWMDCSASGMDGDEVTRRLLEHGLMVNRGSMYGEAGRAFIRINIACPRTLLMQGLEKLLPVLG